MFPKVKYQTKLQHFQSSYCDVKAQDDPKQVVVRISHLA